MFLFLKFWRPCSLDRIILKPAGATAILAAVMLQSSCKTIESRSSVAAVTSTELPATMQCGPNKTFYFHWMSKAGAQGWLKDAGAPAGSNFFSLQAASAQRYPLVPATINTLIRYSQGNGWLAGPGIYLAPEPLSTRDYGDTLLIYRYRDGQGKGLHCDDWSKDLRKEKERNEQAKGSSDLPVLAVYWEPNGYCIGPRAPMAGRGENVVFGLPQVGDAEAFVTEVTNQVSNIEAYIQLFDKLYQNSRLNRLSMNLCSKQPMSGSEIFLQDLYCRTLVSKLAEVLAQSKLGSLSATAKTTLDSLIATYRQLDVSPELMKPIVSFVGPK